MRLGYNFKSVPMKSIYSLILIYYFISICCSFECSEPHTIEKHCSSLKSKYKHEGTCVYFDDFSKAPHCGGS